MFWRYLISLASNSCGQKSINSLPSLGIFRIGLLLEIKLTLKNYIQLSGTESKIKVLGSKIQWATLEAMPQLCELIHMSQESLQIEIKISEQIFE